MTTSLAVGVAATVLVSTLGAPAAAVGSGLLRLAAGVDCPLEAADGALASALAVSCGREVEVVDERTEWSTVHALPDGQMRLDASVSAQRTRVSGEWADIDTSLAPTDEGIAPVSPAVAMVFSDGTPGRPLVRMERDGHELTFDAPFPVGAPVVFGSTLEYRDVLDDVDLVVTVNEDGSGFSEVLRVHSPEAAGDPRIAELTFPVTVSDGLALVGEDGGFVVQDASGAQVFTSPPPVMWDSSADLAAPSLTPRVSGLQMSMASDGSVLDESVLANRAARQDGPLERDRAAVMDVEVDAGADAVVVTPDAGILTNPSTVWPVYIDPSVSGGLGMWISVRDDGWSDFNYSGDQGVGRCGTTGSPMYCSQVFTRRAAWRFYGLMAVGNVEPADVQSATFSAYGSHSYSCTPAPVDAWWAGAFGNGTTWAQLEWKRYVSTRNVAHKPACSNAGFIEFDVTAIAKETAAANVETLTVGLRAGNEGTSAGWKRYVGSTATVSVTYNRPPDTATNLSLASTPSGGSLGCGTAAAPTWLSVATPTLRATLTDPDGTNVSAWTYIYDDAGTLRWQPQPGAFQVNGSQHSQTVPAGVLGEGPLYRWHVSGYDGARTSITHPACYFRVDLVNPGSPQVVALAATGPGEAAYGAGVHSGGVGTAGRFQFTSASGDVDRYAYSFDSTSLSSSAPAANPVVTYVPTSTGEHVLRVQAVDRAQRISDVVTYRFFVARPQQSVWLLEEGAGTTAADSGTFGNQFPLTLTGSPSWVPGPLSEEGSGTDWALRFDGTADVASTAIPAARAGQSFSVSAIVRSEGQASAATAVSQDGSGGPAFELGQVVGSQCADGAGPCWAFQMPASTGAGMVAAVFDDPVPAGEWVQVTGTFDATSGTAMVHVCRPLWWGDPVSGGQVDASGSALGVGPLRLGRSTVAGASASPWAGDIAEVRVYDAVIGYPEMTRTCGSAVS